ncbi:MAG: DUF4921 family protein [Pirellulales bacterium]
MAELRKDPLLERWVLIAEERAARPQEFVDRPVVSRSGSCPFCEGSEAETPHEVFALRAAGTRLDSAGWRMRVIPNKYPAVNLGAPSSMPAVASAPKTECSPAPRPTAFMKSSLSRRGTSPRLDSSLMLKRPKSSAFTKLACAHSATKPASAGLRYVQIFRNVGEAAGASIEHLHSQLVGLPSVPPLILDEVLASARHFAQTGRCPTCDLVAAELKSRERVVEATARFALVCPYASRFPYEMQLVPREHEADFDAADTEQLTEAAGLLRRALARLERVCGEASYNCVLHTAPFGLPEAPRFHWHVEVLPRLVKAAGFEWATGVHINPVSPERAATTLRSRRRRLGLIAELPRITRMLPAKTSDSMEQV